MFLGAETSHQPDPPSVAARYALLYHYQSAGLSFRGPLVLEDKPASRITVEDFAALEDRAARHFRARAEEAVKAARAPRKKPDQSADMARRREENARRIAALSKNCEHCGRPVVLTVFNYSSTRFCSRLCAQRSKRKAPPHPDRANCLDCGEPVAPRRRGPPKKFCADACRIRFNNRAARQRGPRPRRAAEPKPPRPAKLCLQCDRAIFVTGQNYLLTKYCGPTCRQAACRGTFTRPPEEIACRHCGAKSPLNRTGKRKVYCNVTCQRAARSVREKKQ